MYSVKKLGEVESQSEMIYHPELQYATLVEYKILPAQDQVFWTVEIELCPGGQVPRTNCGEMVPQVMKPQVGTCHRHLQDMG